MLLSERTRAILVATLIFAAVAAAPASDDRPTADWLRGSGKDLQLCLQGEVLDSDGQPATDFQLACEMKTMISNQAIHPSIDGNRFKLWIPLNQSRWSSILLKATSKASDHLAYETFTQEDLRQAAIDGVKLTLENPSRHLFVSVTDKGRPVSGAHVKAETKFGAELYSTTDASGIARFNLPLRQELWYLTAWTEDHRIGGFDFDRTPPRDPDAVRQTIELSPCRDQKIRFVDENGSPVPGLDFVIQIATPSPHFNFIGPNEHSHMTTDAAGEAIYRWFPDWPEVYRYADINEDTWILDDDPKNIDGVDVIKLKKSKQRKQIMGQVLPGSAKDGAGGFFAFLRTGQGQREHHSETALAFSNPDGSFAVDVLPDAIYCAYVLDSRWVGIIIDLIPYDSKNDKTTPIQLEVADGQPVEVIVTSGADNKPVPNAAIQLARDHRYSWVDNGKKKTGIDGPGWWVITDDSGIATTHTLPGQLRVSVDTPRWGTGQTVTVSADQPAKITLHRDIGEMHSVKGKLFLTHDATATLQDSEIRIISMDDNYHDEQSLMCNQAGEFSFDTAAATVGIFAKTHDNKAACATIIEDLNRTIELPLHPAIEYQGQLLFKDGEPATGRLVYGVIALEKKDKKLPFPRSFEVSRLETTTDEQGNFILEGLLSGLKTNLYTESSDGLNLRTRLAEVLVQTNESPPRATFRLKETVDPNPPAKHE